MNKEQKEFLTSQHKAGLSTNIQSVYALDSSMALGTTLQLTQQQGNSIRGRKKHVQPATHAHVCW